MRRSLLLIAFTFLAVCMAYGQKDSLSFADKKALDSMLRNDAFLKMLQEGKSSSVDISVGFGNGTFSSHNRAANATGITNQLVITPAVFYHHKSGFSAGITSYITSDSISSGIYQTGLTASYDYTGKLITAGFSYTRYLSNMNKYNSKSIYQNDLFASVKLSKGIIQPIIMLGYANGNYKEMNYVKFRRPLIGDTITVKDSTKNKTSYFSVTGGIEHDFNIYKVFSPKDELDIVPSVVLNAGTDALSSTHINQLYNRIKVLSRRKKTLDQNNKFQLQSLAGALDITYTIGKFFIQPGIYLDYYLPSTTGNRLTTVYSVAIGVSF